MLFGGTVEHEQCIESQRDADVVDDCNVQITTHWTTQSTTVKSIGTKIFVNCFIQRQAIGPAG